MKACSTCGETKPLDAFSRDASKPDGRQRQCKECRQTYYEANKDQITSRMRVYDEANKDRKRDRDLRRRYGISAADWDAVWTAQRGRCDACQRQMTRAEGGGPRETDAVVDHSREFRTVNALLCNRCNLLIGSAGHDPYLLFQLAAYCNDVRASDELIEQAPLGRVPDTNLA